MKKSEAVEIPASEIIAQLERLTKAVREHLNNSFASKNVYRSELLKAEKLLKKI